MQSSATAIVIGYLGRDPVLKYTGQGTAVCDFSLATTVRQGETETTTWWKVKAWSKLAETCNSALTKGAAVQVIGRVTTEEYTDKGGVNQKVLTINADSVNFLSERTAPAETPQRAAAAPQQSSRRTDLDVVMGVEDESDFIPF